MAREKFEFNKLHINVGTIGHVDASKTSLHRPTSTMSVAKRVGVEREQRSTIEFSKEYPGYFSNRSLLPSTQSTREEIQAPEALVKNKV